MRQDYSIYCIQIIPLLTHSDEAISREALALMKALLFSGNEEVQEGVALSVQETREEILFLMLRQRLETASLNYRETLVCICIIYNLKSYAI